MNIQKSLIDIRNITVGEIESLPNGYLRRMLLYGEEYIMFQLQCQVSSINVSHFHNSSGGRYILLDGTDDAVCTLLTEYFSVHSFLQKMHKNIKLKNLVQKNNNLLLNLSRNCTFFNNTDNTCTDEDMQAGLVGLIVKIDRLIAKKDENEGKIINKSKVREYNLKMEVVCMKQLTKSEKVTFDSVPNFTSSCEPFVIKKINDSDDKKECVYARGNMVNNSTLYEDLSEEEGIDNEDEEDEDDEKSSSSVASVVDKTIKQMRTIAQNRPHEKTKENDDGGVSITNKVCTIFSFTIFFFSSSLIFAITFILYFNLIGY